MIVKVAAFHILSIAYCDATEVLSAVQNICSSRGMLVVTFDDGSSPNMDELLTLLSQSGTKATLLFAT